MRVEERHQGQVAVVGGADDSHPAVVARHVADQPVEGVELEEAGGKKHHDDHADAYEHLEGARALDEEERPVKDVIDQRDVNGIVEPPVVGEGLFYFGEIAHGAAWKNKS